MKFRNCKYGFTLVELLVVVAMLALLTSILMPSFSTARELARSAVCLNNLSLLGTSMGLYHVDNNQYFWPYLRTNWPSPGVKCYWWGTDADPVDPSASAFMRCVGREMSLLWCPSLKWGSYLPQGLYVSEPTTTYGYNAYYLLGNRLPGYYEDDGTPVNTTLRVPQLPRASALFVLNDSGMYWTMGGAKFVFQNSTYLEPVTGNYVRQPTTHFRHHGRTNALCADGHAGSYGTEGWDLNHPRALGFVGTQNDPHYAQD